MRTVTHAVRLLPRLACIVLLMTGLTRPAFAVMSNEESVHLLRLAKFTMPEFPAVLRMSGVTRGLVTVAIGRDAEGHVTDTFVLSSDNAGLTESVVTAVRGWRFAQPANRPPPGAEIVPVVRFLFSAKGVSILSGTNGSLTGYKDLQRVDEPLIMPSFADLDAPPKPIEQPMPRLTGSFAERAPNGGTASIRFFVDEDGKVRVPVIVDCTTPELGQAAISAVEQWRFEPPTIGGRSTIARDTISLNFAPTAPRGS